MTSVIVVMIVLGLLVALVVKHNKKQRADGRGGGEHGYKRKPLMTGNELEFYHRLVKAVPAHIQVLPQVAMGGLVESAAEELAAKRKHFWRFGAMRVDFTLYNVAQNTVDLLIELDDRTHQKPRDEKRDEMTRAAGYHTLRFESGSKPTVDQLRVHLLPHLRPTEEARRGNPSVHAIMARRALGAVDGTAESAETNVTSLPE